MGDKWFEEQVGPLPVGVWALVIVAGVGSSLFLRHRMAAQAPAPTDQTSAGSSYTGPSSSQGAVALPGGGAGSSTGGFAAPPATNEEWGRRAADALVARGYAPNVANDMVAHYLAGSQLSIAERAAFNLAVLLVGTPPLAIPIINPIPGTTTGGGGGGGAGNGSVDAPPAPWNQWGHYATIGGRRIYVDNLTNRPAFFGPEGQPGTAVATSHYYKPAIMPDQRVAFYNPTDFCFADTSRPCNGPAQSRDTGSTAVRFADRGSPGQGTSGGVRLAPGAALVPGTPAYYGDLLAKDSLAAANRDGPGPLGIGAGGWDNPANVDYWRTQPAASRPAGFPG